MYDSKPLFWIHYCTTIAFNCDTQPSSVKCTTAKLGCTTESKGQDNGFSGSSAMCHWNDERCHYNLKKPNQAGSARWDKGNLYI